jgi:hypothetical protein
MVSPFVTSELVSQHVFKMLLIQETETFASEENEQSGEGGGAGGVL